MQRRLPGIAQRQRGVRRGPETLLCDRPGGEQAQLMKIVFEHFSGTGEWPSLSELQRDLTRAGQRFDVDAVARTLPRRWGRVAVGRPMKPHPAQDAFQLTIRGAIEIAPGSEEVADFVVAMRIGCERYLAEDEPDPKLTSKMLEERGIAGLRLGEARRSARYGPVPHGRRELVRWVLGASHLEGVSPLHLGQVRPRLP